MFSLFFLLAFESCQSNSCGNTSTSSVTVVVLGISVARANEFAARCHSSEFEFAQFPFEEIQTRSLAFSRNSFVILRNILDQNQEREYQCLEKSGKSSREQLWLSFRSNFPPSGANSDSIFRLMYSLGL